MQVGFSPSDSGVQVVVRGITSNNFTELGDPTVGIHIDGSYTLRPQNGLALMHDVERVEVLRGPQGTLFGKNASAGVISMVTREPSFDFKGSVEASYGNYDALVLKGYVTGPISDKVAASIAGGINKRDGYITDLGYNGTANERDRWFVRGQLRIEPSDVLKVRLIADYDKINEVCCAIVNVRRSAATTAIEALGGKVNNSATPFAGVSYSNFPSTNDIQNWGLSGQIASQTLTLRAAAQVTANIGYSTVVIESGAQIEGRFARNKD